MMDSDNDGRFPDGSRVETRYPLRISPPVMSSPKVLDRVQQFAACQQPTQVSEQIIDAGVAEFSRDRLLHLLPRLVGVRALSLPEACQSRPPKTPVGSARYLDEPRTDQRCPARARRIPGQRPSDVYSWHLYVG